MHLSEWKYQRAWNETNEKYQWAWKLSCVRNITVVLICMSYLLFFSSRSPKKVLWGISLFIKTLTLTLWRFIFIGAAHHLPRAPRGSLVSLRLYLSPVISSCHRKVCSFPQFSELCSGVDNCSFRTPYWWFWSSFLSLCRFQDNLFSSSTFPSSSLTVTLCSIIETFQECQCMQMLSPSQYTLAKNMDEKQVW